MIRKQKKLQLNPLTIYQEVFLISEYCFMTGFTEKMRGDFNLNKDIAETTKQNPQQRMNKLKELLSEFQSSANPKACHIFRDFHLK